MWFRRVFHNLIVTFKTPPYTKGFANRTNPNYLNEHFQTHESKLRALGITTVAEYEIAADRFCGGKIDKNTLLCIRPKDGAWVLYNIITNEFGFVSRDGVIITYFVRPKNQMAYFLKQCSDTGI